jgi:hypothetical protein
MRESRTYGSVRGVRGNSHPYRDEGVSKADAVSRCKSDPGKAEQAAWRRVLREAATMPNTKRTQLLRGVCDRATKWAYRRSGDRAHG